MDVKIINGVPIAYRHRPGLGRTIVFVHFLGGNQTVWDDVIAALPGGYGILTLDLRGHGLSGGEAESIEGLAADVGALIDALGLTDVLYCGISIGGMVGQVLAATRADVVRGAVYCNTAPRIGTTEKWDTRIADVKSHGLNGIADDVIATWFGSAYVVRKDRLALHKAMLSRTDDAGYCAACAAIRDADLRDFSAKFDMPVLCVGGREDQSVPPDAVEGLAQSIEGAEVAMLDDVGHLPCLETPVALARLIEAFDPAGKSRSAAGFHIRSAVLGEAHVARASEGVTDLDRAFQTLITEGAWGNVWASPGISARERSMLTLALLAATGNFEEIPMHIRATARTGATERDIAEAMQHVAIYAGVPRANHALKLAKATLLEMEDD